MVVGALGTGTGAPGVGTEGSRPVGAGDCAIVGLKDGAKVGLDVGLDVVGALGEGIGALGVGTEGVGAVGA